MEDQGSDADKPAPWCGLPTGGHGYPQNFSAQESKAFFDRFK